MIKKEFRDIAGPTLIKLSTLILIPVIKLIDILFVGTAIDYIEVTITWIGVLIFWISIDYCTKFFKFENNDHSWEYLLSLPISRRRILFIKLFPRLVNISILFTVYLTALKLFPDQVTVNKFDILHPYFLIPLSLAYIINGPIFCMGKIKDKYLLTILNYISIGFMTVVIYLYLKSIYVKIYDEYPFLGSIFTAIAIITALISIIYIKYFKVFDLKPSHIHGRLFTRLAMPYLLFVILICALMIFFRINNVL
jgi:hypothetical protein